MSGDGSGNACDGCAGDGAPLEPLAPDAPLPDEQSKDAKSIAVARQKELDDYQPSSTLRVEIGPDPEGGTEIVFPPMRSAAHAVTQTVIFVFSFGLFVFALAQLSSLVAVTWGMANLLLFNWLLRIWFATERVVINDGQVSLTNGLFRMRQTMPLAQVSSIHVIAGPMTGRHAIRIRGAGWHHLDVGDGIADQRDAEWLAAQMSRAAGIEPASFVRGGQSAEDMELMTEFVGDVAEGKVNFGPLGNALIDMVMRKRKDD
jgi:hypothetical protein